MYVLYFKKTLFLIILIVVTNMLGGCTQIENTDTQIKNSSNVTSYEQVSSTEIHTSKVFYRIEYDFVLLKNNNVGNDWEKSVFVNGKNFKSGDALFVNSGEIVEIKILISENDKVPDQSIHTVKLNIKDGNNICETIVVCENRGKYSGNTALWQFSCRVNKK